MDENLLKIIEQPLISEQELRRRENDEYRRLRRKSKK